MKNITLLNLIYSGKSIPGVADLLKNYLHEDRQEKQKKWSVEDHDIKNPGITYLEQRIAAMEGGRSAVSVKSFSAAKKLLFDTLLRSGDNIIVHNAVKFSINERVKLLRRGIEIRVMKNDELYSFTELLTERTKLVYVETIDSETLEVVNLNKIAAYTKLYRIPLVADNTLGTAGYFVKPITFGANIVITSTKRWLHTYRSVVGALIIDAGNYDWTNERYLDIYNYYQAERNKYSKADIPENFSLIHLLRNKSNTDYNKHIFPLNSLLLLKEIEGIHASAKIQTKQAKEFTQWILQAQSIGKVIYPVLRKAVSDKRLNPVLKNGFGYDIAFSFFNETLNRELVNDLKVSQYKEYVDYSEIERHIKIHVPALKGEEFIKVLKDKIQICSNKKQTEQNYFQLNSLVGSF